MYEMFNFIYNYFKYTTAGDTKKVTFSCIWGAIKRGTERVVRAFSRLMNYFHWIVTEPQLLQVCTEHIC